ncbi:hypothetical protein LTR09_008827 [Extremus antarcticus]|uniref:Vacuolar calcium ion transporter n=1 Tax=Extremus antarcticus TaxID=702011 RepID=A0AAJ0DGL0_9PEZI|nr:hypothetical protein LTR09_008827 [Extremus antarcticus]
MTTRPKPTGSGDREKGQPEPLQQRGMHLFKRKKAHPNDTNNTGGNPMQYETDGSPMQQESKMERGEGQQVNHNGHIVHKRIEPDGESGRSWFHPLHFFRICWTSSNHVSKYTNILWPFTIAAMVLHFLDASKPKEERTHSLWIFITAYIGMVPAANLVGFAGQELARKIPKVLGVILETTFGSIVEIILFMVLIKGGAQNVQVIQAAILGSLLANMLLCLGTCFFVGGIFYPQQTFHEAISEVGSNLMLVAGMGLIIPTVYYNSLYGRDLIITGPRLITETLHISRATAIVLFVAFLMYIWFQSRSHHSLYEDILEADEERDHDRHKDLTKAKLTFTESVVALLIALTFVSFMAIFLVQQIEYIVTKRGVSDHFVGLILIPLVEKASEHLTAVDEAYDNQMNFALAHVLGASIQTALLNTPLVVIVGWGLKINMGLNFELFDAVVLILAIVVVGNFLRDEKSDYLEGALCVMVYILIAVTAWYYPNPLKVQEEIAHLAEEAAHGGGKHAARMLFMG